MCEEGRLVPPYPVDECRAIGCEGGFDQHGAYLHRNRENGKLVVLCGACSMKAQMNDPLRLPLVAL